jgi:hypothetical protein
MRDRTEIPCTYLFGIRIVGVKWPQNVVADGRRPFGLHLGQNRDRRVGSTTEWGDGPFDHVNLVTGVHVALETKDDVIPCLGMIP